MKAKLSKTFYLKTAILLFFLVASLILSFSLGRKFGYFLMGDIQNEEKLMANVDQPEDDGREYTPLVSSRFKYKPEEFPRSEYSGYISEKPQEEDVLEEGAKVDMNYAGGTESADNLFDLGEKSEGDEVSEDENQPEDETVSNLLYKVLVGTFENRENAENLYKLLRDDNYDPYIEAVVEGETTHYRVQIGAFHDVDNANSLAEELRKKGYNAWTKYSKK